MCPLWTRLWISMAQFEPEEEMRDLGEGEGITPQSQYFPI